jgi:hypothetical protein
LLVSRQLRCSGQFVIDMHLHVRFGFVGVGVMDISCCPCLLPMDTRCCEDPDLNSSLRSECSSCGYTLIMAIISISKTAVVSEI